MNLTVSDMKFRETIIGMMLRLGAWSGESLRTQVLTSKERDEAIRRVDAGRMAALKRSARCKQQPDDSIAWIVGPLIPEEWDPESLEYRIVFQIALLYTTHQYSRTHDLSKRYWPSLTDVISDANGDRQGAWRKEFTPQDKRINRLLSVRKEEDLFGLLIKFLTPLMNESVEPVDWVQLGRDMRDWEDPDRRVQLRWAHGWYGGLLRKEASFPSSENASLDADS